MQITAYAPATVANVACGFDILGFAVEKPGDTVTVNFKKTAGVKITKIIGNKNLPLDAAKNTAGYAIIKLLEYLNEKRGIEMELHKNMPLGSGLGSSAASSVAALLAVNKILGEPLTRKELIPFAMEGERLACGAAHADNVAPALLGGFTLIRSYDPLDVIRIKTPKNLFAAVIHPHVEVSTEDARKILKKQITLKQAITQWGNTAGLIAGLLQEDLGLIARSLQDVVIEPIRSPLIPGFNEVKAAALKAGALGCSISGSGPSIFALADSISKAQDIAKNMENEILKMKIKCDVFVSPINQEGAKIL